MRSSLLQNPPAAEATVVQDDLHPRCSVYPHLVADYWCTQCHCYVSSHCHVRGVHRDHVFITVREAAEGHLDGLRQWASRCESQLLVANGVVDYLGSAQATLQRALTTEGERLEAAYEAIMQSLSQRKEQLKNELRTSIVSEMRRTAQAADQVQDVINFYKAYQHHCALILESIPPVGLMDEESTMWSADVMRTVELLRAAGQVASVPLPMLQMPSVVSSNGTPIDCAQQLLSLERRPLDAALAGAGASSPEELNVEPFHYTAAPLVVSASTFVSPARPPQQYNPASIANQVYPSPTRSTHDSSRLLHSTQPPSTQLQLLMPLLRKDTGSDIVIHNGVTLTLQDDGAASRGPQSHTLVRASQCFSSSLHAWDVHVDRIEPGDDNTGHILAGILLEGTDGEGVVWDGQYIVGPHERECRVLPATFRIRRGTTMSFVLDLRVETRATLHCFLDHRLAAVVPLPVAQHGWTPAVSVLSASDQVTLLTRSVPEAEALLSSSRSAESPSRMATVNHLPLSSPHSSNWQTPPQQSTLHGRRI